MTMLLGLDRPEPEAAREQGQAVSPNAAQRVAVLPFELPGLDALTAQVMVGLQDALFGELPGAMRRKLVQVRDLDTLGLATAAPARIGEKLRVSHLVRGSIQRAGSALQVKLQLIEVQSGALQWSSEVRGQRDALFKLQAAVARELAVALGGDAARISAEEPASNAAYDAYLAALAVIRGSGNYNDRGSSVELLDQALAEDPDFVAAHVLAALQKSASFWFGTMDRDQAETDVNGHLAALRRLSAQPHQIATVQAIRSYYLDYDPRGGAAALDPHRSQLGQSNEATMYYAAMLRRIERIDEAIALLNANVRRQPGDLRSLLLLAETYFVSGNGFAAMELLASAAQIYADSARLLQYAQVFGYRLTGDRRFLDAYLASDRRLAPEATALAHQYAALLDGGAPALVDVLNELPRVSRASAGAPILREVDAAIAHHLAGHPKATVQDRAELALRLINDRRSRHDSPPLRLHAAQMLALLERREEALLHIDAVLQAFPPERDEFNSTLFANYALHALLLLGEETRAVELIRRHAAGTFGSMFCGMQEHSWHWAIYAGRPQAQDEVAASCHPQFETHRRELRSFADQV